MDRRLFVLVAVGLGIAGACAIRATRTYAPSKLVATATVDRPAPPFELYDQSAPSKLVRLTSFLGRERVIVVFFDGAAGAHRSPPLVELRDNLKALRRQNVQILGVSTALPQHNRKDAAAAGPFPFPLLSDPDRSVLADWGLTEGERGATRVGFFLVDRAGNVPWSRETQKPQPIADWQTTIGSLLGAQ